MLEFFKYYFEWLSDPKSSGFLQWCSLWLWWTPVIMFNSVIKIINRFIRSSNIKAVGWPTNPLMDADGDIVHPKKEDD